MSVAAIATINSAAAVDETMTTTTATSMCAPSTLKPPANDDLARAMFYLNLCTTACGLDILPPDLTDYLNYAALPPTRRQCVLLAIRAFSPAVMNRVTLFEDTTRSVLSRRERYRIMPVGDVPRRLRARGDVRFRLLGRSTSNEGRPIRGVVILRSGVWLKRLLRQTRGAEAAARAAMVRAVVGHCEHCVWGGPCQCNTALVRRRRWCERPMTAECAPFPSNLWTHKNHCHHCIGHAGPCQCPVGCARTDNPSCFPVTPDRTCQECGALSVSVISCTFSCCAATVDVCRTCYDRRAFIWWHALVERERLRHPPPHTAATVTPTATVTATASVTKTRPQRPIPNTMTNRTTTTATTTKCNPIHNQHRHKLDRQRSNARRQTSSNSSSATTATTSSSLSAHAHAHAHAYPYIAVPPHTVMGDGYVVGHGVGQGPGQGQGQGRGQGGANCSCHRPHGQIEVEGNAAKIRNENVNEIGNGERIGRGNKENLQHVGNTVQFKSLDNSTTNQSSTAESYSTALSNSQSQSKSQTRSSSLSSDATKTKSRHGGGRHNDVPPVPLPYNNHKRRMQQQSQTEQNNAGDWADVDVVEGSKMSLSASGFGLGGLGFGLGLGGRRGGIGGGGGGGAFDMNMGLEPDIETDGDFGHASLDGNGTNGNSVVRLREWWGSGSLGLLRSSKVTGGGGHVSHGNSNTYSHQRHDHHHHHHLQAGRGSSMNMHLNANAGLLNDSDVSLVQRTNNLLLRRNRKRQTHTHNNNNSNKTNTEQASNKFDEQHAQTRHHHPYPHARTLGQHGQAQAEVVAVKGETPEAGTGMRKKGGQKAVKEVRFMDADDERGFIG